MRDREVPRRRDPRRELRGSRCRANRPRGRHEGRRGRRTGAQREDRHHRSSKHEQRLRRREVRGGRDTRRFVREPRAGDDELGADSDDEASALAIRAKGKIVAVGSSGCASCSGHFAFAAADLPDGALDMGFADDGTTTISIGPGSSTPPPSSPTKRQDAGHGRHRLPRRARTNACRWHARSCLGAGGTVRSLWGGCANGWDAARYGRTRVVVAGPDEIRFGLARYQAA